MLGTVTKAGKLMTLFTTSQPEWGVSEVAAEMLIPKSSAHALLSSLSEVGLVRRLPSGRYRLGWLVVSLSRTLLDTTAFVGSAKPHLQQVADQVGGAFHLAALRGPDVIYLEKITSPVMGGFTETTVGGTAPAHSTALGKVLLAYADPAYSARIVRRYGLPRHTDQTITSWRRLTEELALVRQRGWGIDIDETVDKVCCVAAPVRDVEGNVQAALSMTMSAKRFHHHGIALQRCIIATAAAISQQGRRGSDSTHQLKEVVG